MSSDVELSLTSIFFTAIGKVQYCIESSILIISASGSYPLSKFIKVIWFQSLLIDATLSLVSSIFCLAGSDSSISFTDLPATSFLWNSSSICVILDALALSTLTLSSESVWREIIRDLNSSSSNLSSASSTDLALFAILAILSTIASFLSSSDVEFTALSSEATLVSASDWALVTVIFSTSTEASVFLPLIDLDLSITSTLPDIDTLERFASLVSFTISFLTAISLLSLIDAGFS